MNMNSRKRNNNSSIDKGVNKKRKKLSREELHEQDVEIRYSKLVNKAAKLLRKEAKVCKTFECQKIIRKIKAMNKSFIENDPRGHSYGDDGDDEKVKKPTETDEDHNNTIKIRKKIQNLEEKLNITKSLDLDEVVNISLTRLGLDPSKVGSKKANNNSKNSYKSMKGKDDNEPIIDDATKEYQTKLMESILKHKKMVYVIENVNESFTDYNRWLAREEEWISTSGKKSSKKTNKKHDNANRTYKSSSDISAHIADTGLFIDSLAGGEGGTVGYQEEEDVNAELLDKYASFGQDEEGNANDYDYEMYTDIAPKAKKKNRMGQRERKARAMALEAMNNNGKPYDPRSIKMWWELKPKNPKNEKAGALISKDNGVGNNHQLASGLDASKKVNVSEVVKMGTNWKDEGKAHPSWAARQVQKSKSGSGIGNIEFKGKKITFD